MVRVALSDRLREVGVVSWLTRQLDVSFGRPVERDYWESDRAFRRRRLVVVATLLVGAALLGVSLLHPRARQPRSTAPPSRWR